MKLSGHWSLLKLFSTFWLFSFLLFMLSPHVGFHWPSARCALLVFCHGVSIHFFVGWNSSSISSKRGFSSLYVQECSSCLNTWATVARNFLGYVCIPCAFLSIAALPPGNECCVDNAAYSMIPFPIFGDLIFLPGCLKYILLFLWNLVTLWGHASVFIILYYFS